MNNDQLLQSTSRKWNSNVAGKSSTYVNIPFRRSWSYVLVCNIKSCGVFWLFHLEKIFARCQKLVIQAWTKFSIWFENNLKSGLFCIFGCKFAPKFFPNWRQKVSFYLNPKNLLFDKNVPIKNATYVKVPLRKFNLLEVGYIELSEEKNVPDKKFHLTECSTYCTWVPLTWSRLYYYTILWFLRGLSFLCSFIIWIFDWIAFSLYQESCTQSLHDLH